MGRGHKDYLAFYTTQAMTHCKKDCLFATAR